MSSYLTSGGSVFSLRIDALMLECVSMLSIFPSFCYSLVLYSLSSFLPFVIFSLLLAHSFSSPPSTPALSQTSPPKTQIKGMMQTRLFLMLDPFQSESTCQQPLGVKKASFYSQCKNKHQPHMVVISMCKTKYGIKLCINSTLEH